MESSAADVGVELFLHGTHGPLFVPTVVYCSAALVQNAALQTWRAAKGKKQSTTGVQWQITMGRARSLLVGGCVRQYHEQTVVRCRQADTSPVRFEPQVSDTSKAANSSGLRVSRRCRFVSGCSEISVYVMSYTWKARCVGKKNVVASGQ